MQRHAETKGKIEAEFGKIEQTSDSVSPDGTGGGGKFYELEQHGAELVADGHPELAPVLATLKQEKVRVAELWAERHKVCVHQQCTHRHCIMYASATRSRWLSNNSNVSTVASPCAVVFLFGTLLSPLSKP